MCRLRKYPYPLQEWSLEIPRAWWVSIAKVSRESMKLSWKFRLGGGGGVKTK